jgi:hypothetical protein
VKFEINNYQSERDGTKVKVKRKHPAIHIQSLGVDWNGV